MPITFNMIVDSIRKNILFLLMVLVTLGAVYWMYLQNLYVVQDYNPEAMDIPLTLGYMDLAKSQGVPAREFMNNSPIFEDTKREDPMSFAYYGKRFEFDLFVHVAPFLASAYYPFVVLTGVNGITLANYSTFFCLMTLVCLFVLVLVMYDKWSALFSVLFLVSSLAWLIHMKIGYSAWMPSVFVTCLIVLLLYLYQRSGGIVLLIATGVLFACLYLTAWISAVTSFVMITMTLVLAGRGYRKGIFADLFVFGLSSVCAVLFFVFVYAKFFNCSQYEVYKALFDVFFMRYSEGGITSFHPSISGKLAYAFKCLFVDMIQFDHTDKHFEGGLAVPPVFSVCFIVGLLLMIKNRSSQDKLILVWLVSVFCIVGYLYLYAHRYGLLVLPAMAVIASIGMVKSLRAIADLKIKYALSAGAAIWLGFSLLQTHDDYYVGFTLNRRPDFDSDALRGVAKVATWLKKNYSPVDTLVVLSDRMMFSRTQFLFYTFGYNYHYRYWANYIKPGATAANVADFEKSLPVQYKNIVFVFSTTLLADRASGLAINDFRPFLAAHPGIRPVMTYNYGDRPPSKIMFEISRGKE